MSRVLADTVCTCLCDKCSAVKRMLNNLEYIRDNHMSSESEDRVSLINNLISVSKSLDCCINKCVNE